MFGESEYLVHFDYKLDILWQLIQKNYPISPHLLHPKRNLGEISPKFRL